MLLLRFAAALSLAVLCSPALADSREDGQLWFQVVAQGPVAGDVVYFAELQPRFGNDASDMTQMIVRAGVGLALSDTVTVYQGYANVRTRLADGRFSHEDRSFQQVNWSLGRPGGVALSLRTRLEQRWLSTGDDTGWRVRQMIRAAIPIKQSSKVALLGSTEVFIALDDTDWGAKGGFDRVRTFVGLELPLSGKSTVEVGYLNQFVDTATGRNQIDHVAAINLMLRE